MKLQTLALLIVAVPGVFTLEEQNLLLREAVFGCAAVLVRLSALAWKLEQVRFSGLGLVRILGHLSLTFGITVSLLVLLSTSQDKTVFGLEVFLCMFTGVFFTETYKQVRSIGKGILSKIGGQSATDSNKPDSPL
jgi:hypothetical protein